MDDLIVLAGQSNMVGQGCVADIPETMRSGLGTLQFFENDGMRSLLADPMFGPEVGLVRAWRMHHGGRVPWVCKVARGGANLFYDWNPDGVSKGPEDDYRGPMYPALITAVQRVREEARAQGCSSLNLRGVVWMQGERDSVFEFMAARYADNLKGFIRALRRDLQTPDLPFVMGRIAPRVYDLEAGGHRHAFRDRVRESQAVVAKEVSGVSLVETDDLPQTDNLHFDTAGQLLLGERFAAALLS